METTEKKSNFFLPKNQSLLLLWRRTQASAHRQRVEPSVVGQQLLLVVIFAVFLPAFEAVEEVAEHPLPAPEHGQAAVRGEPFFN
jgi:hypothetical protein